MNYDKFFIDKTVAFTNSISTGELAELKKKKKYHNEYSKKQHELLSLYDVVCPFCLASVKVIALTAHMKGKKCRLLQNGHSTNTLKLYGSILRKYINYSVEARDSNNLSLKGNDERYMNELLNKISLLKKVLSNSNSTLDDPTHINESAIDNSVYNSTDDNSLDTHTSITSQ